MKNRKVTSIYNRMDVIKLLEIEQRLSNHKIEQSIRKSEELNQKAREALNKWKKFEDFPNDD